jgi:hypothetical protein
MKLEHAQAIHKAALSMDLRVEVKETYYGRGRGDRSTSAVYGSIGDCIRGIAAVAADLAVQDTEQSEAFIVEMDLSMDSLGKDIILY